MELLSNSHRDKSESQIFVETLCNEYIDKHVRVQERDDLIQENEIEKRDIKGYHGREILELLQNSDDAYQKSINEGNKPDCELEVLIEFKNNLLKVSNTGTYFDKDGIKAIVQGNNSPKSGKYIGNKGTGFRSVLNWADEIRVFSGEFNVKFSKEIANKIFEDIKSEKQIEKQLLRHPNLYIPILAVPQNIEPYMKHDRTAIEIVVNPEHVQDDFGVTKQINNIDLRILLFLPNIRCITIKMEENIIVYESEVNGDEFKSITLKKYVNNQVQVQEKFYVFNKVIEGAIDEDGYRKDIRLAIAVPSDFDTFESGNIYSFFPLLDVESPFNCVMHASYILGDHRDTISRDEANKTIIIEQLKFLVEVAEKFAFKKYSNIGIRLLTPLNFKRENWKFPPAFSHFLGLEETYFKVLESAKILQTVNDEYISIKDNPIMFEHYFPEFFIGTEFKTLLKPICYQSFILIQTVSKGLNYNLIVKENELLPIINKIAVSWTMIQQVEVFIWWNRYYKNSLPNLLKTQSGRWLRYGDECYFLVGDFLNLEIPDWVSVPSLDIEYQKILFKETEQLPDIQKVKETDKDTHISRLITQRKIYPLVKFAYRDRSNIIATVNSSVDSYEKSIDFVKWLWGNYREESESWTPPKGSDQSPIRYNFPNVKNEKVQDSRKLFFGHVYGNNLARKLFDESYTELPFPDFFSVSNEQTKRFIDFISKFGVKKFPVIEKQGISPLPSFLSKYEKIISEHGDLGYSTSFDVNYEIPFITHLEIKLKSLTTLEVVRWIYEDYKLRSYLSSPFYSGDAEILYIGNLQQKHRYYYGPIQNYLLYVFNEVKWVEISGKKYAPTQVIKDINSRNNQKFSDLIPIVDVMYIQKMAHSLDIEYNEVLKIIELFNFCDKATDLGSNDFYSLMLRLPLYDFEKSADLSKSIYRIIEQANFTLKYDESENKTTFFASGKVLVQYEGKLQYYPAKESYLPSTKIISKKNVPIVEKGQRTNNDNFIRMFGCQQYNKDYSILKETISESKSNQNFQQYFSEFLKYARAYGERNENFERNIGKISIILVDKISIVENNQVSEIVDDYTCIRESVTSWYISVLENEFEINQISEVIENICANIANTPGFESGKLGELFRAREQDDREFLIKKEFGSFNVIADTTYKNEVRNNFIETINRLNKNYPVDEINIDFENFSSEQNSEKLIKLLSNIGLDVNQFRNSGFVYEIDLIPYHKLKLMRFINNEKRKFKNNLYTKAVMDESLQRSFLETIIRFENFAIETYENSIYFDVEAFVRALFGNWNNDELQGYEILDSNAEYSKNYELLNPNILFEDEISNNVNVQRMIYFNKAKEFEMWLDGQKATQQSNTIEPVDTYSKYKGVIPQKEEPAFRDPISVKEARKSRTHGAYTPGLAERRNRNQKVFGNKGELIIYNLLCEEYGEDNVYPKSEAFVEIGILKPGQASSGKYDLSYKNESGTEFFVEVKTGDGKSFIISPGELDFAKQNPDQFKLFLVYEIDSETPKYIELPKKFWDNKKFRKTEIIERIEFEF